MSQLMMSMSNMNAMHQDITVKRTDPVYMAHAYLTKVPVAAIEPFIQAFTQPGDTVADPFAGSGMTGVAAAASGRAARLFDISVLGRHIGRNYVNLVDPGRLEEEGKRVAAEARRRVGDVYAISCRSCGNVGQLAKSVWSVVIACPQCDWHGTFYGALEKTNWSKRTMACPSCEALIAKGRRVGEERVLDYIDCGCSRAQHEQPPTESLHAPNTDGLEWPKVEISADRQMYQASALGKHGLTTVASFYSARNLASLAALRDAIRGVEDNPLRDKLLFAFTAILTRASKRYQWSRKRPLNAANANYYIAPVFYEWNVFDLFARKIEAAIRSDDWLRAQRGVAEQAPDVTYEIASAEKMPLDDESVDYVFMDPPFGSNLFYADMALFQEAWLGEFTDHSLEAVIDRGTRKNRDGDRYESLLTAALRECRRIVRADGWITMVFGNSSGAVWGLVQRAVANAGLAIEADTVAILNKSQRSVKGLASGFEHVATTDLILSMRRASGEQPVKLQAPHHEDVEAATLRLLGDSKADSPSHLYLELLRHGIRDGWDLSGLDLRWATGTIRREGWTVDPASGRLAPHTAAA